MKLNSISKRVLLLIVFSYSFFTGNSFAQLVINSGLTPQQLANAISGPGVTIFNVSFAGLPSMSGSFTATGTNLGINSGIVLATGDANFTIGPNNSTNAGNDMLEPGDSTLDSIANLYSSNPIITHDACILEFDFMCQSSTVSFNYVFGSEEYPEYVCSQYNDVFAFFISGPGISAPYNMALIPSTSTPVAINTVNSGMVGAFGTNGPHCGLGYTTYYVDNTGGATIELDGFTTPLTASAIIQPCKVYHLRIMIADAGDGVFDSGVFIQAGSFSSNPVVSAGADQVTCSGNPVSIGAPSAPGYSYNWSPATGLSSTTVSDPTVTLTNSTTNPITQTYVIVANNGQCLFSDTVQITIDPAPAVSFTVTPSQACAGQNMTVDYTGTAASGYTWDFGSANVISGSGSGPYVISFPSTGNDTISLVASNPGCSGTASQTVLISGNPVASFTSPPQACEGDTIIITFDGTAGSAASYSWAFGGGTVISGSGQGPYSVTWPSAGSPSVSLTIDENGCLSSPFLSQLTIDAIPVAIAGNDTAVCSGFPVPLGGQPLAGYTYQWLPATGLDNPAASSPVATLANTGITQLTSSYQVTVTSSQGCISQDNVIVTINPGINVDFVAPAGKCLNGNSFDFAVRGSYPSGSVFNWNFGSAATPATSSAASVSGVTFSAPGVYQVTLDAASGSCPMPTVPHTVEIFPEPVADFSAVNREACSPLIAAMNNVFADTGFTYSWRLNGVVQSSDASPIFNLATPGQYDVMLTATTIHGCSISVTRAKYLTVYALPVAQFDAAPSIASITAPVISFINNTINAQSYLWDFGDGVTAQGVNQSHTYADTGFYNVMLVAVSNGGCMDTAYRLVEINEGFDYFIPNAFSPNGDGINDYFQGYGINFKSVEMLIYDRWGKKIYETTSPFRPWDGRVKEFVQNDVYVYKITVTDKMDNEHSYVGSVTVVK